MNDLVVAMSASGLDGSKGGGGEGGVGDVGGFGLIGVGRADGRSDILDNAN
jgi:hypothetical protein